MLVIKRVNGVVTLSSVEEASANQWGHEFETRNDWTSFEQAEEVATQLTNSSGEQYVATDSGPNIYPRFDVARVPKVGDPVSFYFNGDRYPCGYVTHVSKTLKVVTTDEGRKFYRRRQTGGWMSGGWCLLYGHKFEQNPHF